MSPEGVSVGGEWVAPAETLSAYKLWQLQKKRAEMRKNHLDLWESTVSLTGTGRPVDAIISPVASYAAVPHGKNRCVLAIIFNLRMLNSCLLCL